MAGVGINLVGDASLMRGDTFGNAKVNLPTDADQSGYSRPMSEVDTGDFLGTPTLLAEEVTEDYQSRSALGSVLGRYQWIAAAQDTGKSAVLTTTMTLGYSGQLTTNASSIVTASTAAIYSGKQYYPVYSASVTYVYLKLRWNGTWGVTNTTMDITLGQCATSNPYAPTDGVGIRANNLGVFGFSSVNGTEQTTSNWLGRTDADTVGGTFAPTIGTCYDVIISASSRSVKFWIDFQYGNGFENVAKINLSNATRRPMNALSGCLNVRHAIGGTAASAVQQMVVVEAVVVNEGVVNMRDPKITAALLSGGHQGQQGQTMGSKALFTNSLAPTAGAAMTNTTAALGTGLGGQFSAIPTLAANTDGVVCSYQNPVPTAAIPAVNLMISGYSITGVVTTVLANAAPVIYVFSMAYGHTSVSLATAEGPSTKAPRRIPMEGIMSFAINAAVGTVGNTVKLVLQNPIPVYAGEFVAVVAKNIGTVTTSGVVTFIVTPDYVEVM